MIFFLGMDLNSNAIKLYRNESFISLIYKVKNTILPSQGEVSLAKYEALGMQVKDLAELFGVSRNTIGNWVNDSKPKPECN